VASDYESSDVHPKRAPQGGIMMLITPEGLRSVYVLFDEIEFGFKPSALRTLKEIRIEAAWTKSPSIRGKKVHVRTRLGVFRTKWDSIKDIIEALPTILLHRTNRGTFANLDRIGEPELLPSLGKCRIGYAIKPLHGEPTWEWVHVSRTPRKAINKLLRF
jgi:hypothetical protein